MDTAIIGGGLAGLCVALELDRQGKKFLLFEKSNQFGGKIRTIEHEGFRLDIGFQVLLSAYPSLRKLLKDRAFNDLSPCYFDSGAILLKDGKSYTLGDPVRQPKDVLSTAFCPLITMQDKLLTLALRNELARYSFDEVLDKTEWQEIPAIDFIKQRGFSEDFINNFTKPFFGGVFGDDSLNTRASNFAFCYKAFAEGKVFLPSTGIGELTERMQATLSPEMVMCDSTVQKLEFANNKVNVVLEDGKFYSGNSVVLATELESAVEILGEQVDDIERVTYSNLYFTSEESLYQDKKIFLNCNKTKVINNGIQVSNISNLFVPKNTNQHLISVTVLNSDIYDLEQLPQKCEEELTDLFPNSKNKLTFLKQFDISSRTSLLSQTKENYLRINSIIEKLKAKLPENVTLAGEYLTEACSQETVITSLQN